MLLPARGLDGQTPMLVISHHVEERLPEGWIGASPPGPAPEQQIPTMCGHRPPRPPAEERRPVRRVVRRNSRLEAASTLPSFSAPNCRSLRPKLNSFVEDMKMREVGVALCSETWEKKDCKKYQKEVERLLELEGMKMVSEPRKYKRGGGVCILADLTKVAIQPIEIPNPNNLEIVFAIVRPHHAVAMKEIITFAFYSPPKSRKKSKLVDHIVTTLHSLMSSFPRAGVMGGGDRNCLDIRPILAAVPRLTNIQQLPTHSGRNLDVLLSTLAPFYSAPLIVQPVGTDDPLCGVPSDHMVPIVHPINNITTNQSKQYHIKVTRPLPDSVIREFGKAIIDEEWHAVKEDETSEEQEAALQKILIETMDKTCPTKTVKLRDDDKPYITMKLKELDRKRKREFNTKGKTAKYKEANKDFKRKLQQEERKFLKKNVDDLMEANPSQAYGVLKRLAAQPGDFPEAGCFNLPGHAGLSPAESANRLAEHFAAISQEFTPLGLEELPMEVQSKIKQRKGSDIPYISRQKVESKINEAKNTKGGVPGDLPVKLTKEFGPEIARPAAQLFRTIAKSGVWPSRWRTERGIPLKKVSNPETEDDIRIISLTPFLSKVFEKFVVEWLYSFIADKLDVNQYGGKKGTSVNHYLIDLVTFVLYNQDQKEPRAVLAAMVDFQKAFNRQDHATLIAALAKMGVPGWLLFIVMGFLMDRQLVVAHMGEESGKKYLPGGGPQGTVLGMLLFLVLINDAGFMAEDRTIGTRITKAKHVRNAISSLHLKYVDDLTILESIDLKSALSVDTEKTWERPLNFHERTTQELNQDQSLVQKQLFEIEDYAKINKMKINQKKTKVMLFNRSKHNDFQPNLLLCNERADLVEQMKLLGVIITSDLKWHENTKHIVKKAFAKIWMLRRLKSMGASRKTLLDVYSKHVRSVVEFAAVVWTSGVTKECITQIERVQKSAFAIILAQDYISYNHACELLDMKTLSERREILSYHFALKASEHPVHSQWFVQNVPNANTRSVKPNFKPPQGRTQQFLKSTIPYLTEILNQNT